MASFHSKTFLKFDDYTTPFSAWCNIRDFIPKDKKIWEPFYCDGQSGKDLTSLGFDVIHKKMDFFTNNVGKIIVTNPPFTQIPEILERLVILDKAFIMIMPSSKINTQYFRKLFKDNHIQIIIPKKRIQFTKISKGMVGFEDTEVCEKQCAFDCFYYCWKMNLKNDITWLD